MSKGGPRLGSCGFYGGTCWREGHEIKLCTGLVTEGGKSMCPDSHDRRDFGENGLGFGMEKDLKPSLETELCSSRPLTWSWSGSERKISTVWCIFGLCVKGLLH